MKKLRDDNKPKNAVFRHHNVPESVSRMLESAGYNVIRLREKTAPDSPDTLVAAVAEANNAVLVTMDGDFKSIAARIGRNRDRKLSILRFEKWRESQAPKRLSCALSLIEHEWKVGDGARDRRMFVVICSTVIRIYH